MKAAPQALARIGILVLVLALVLCFLLPMSGSDMGVAMVCCFVLAALVSLVLLIDRMPIAAISTLAPDRRQTTAGGPPPARAPDPVALGILLA